MGQGGAERQLFYILKALKENGAAPSLFCLTKNEYWEKPIRALGIDSHWFGRSPSRLIRLSDCMKQLNASRPSIVQSQHFYTNIYASLSAKCLNLQDVGAIRSDAISEVKENGLLFGKMSLKIPTHIAANSKNGIRNALSFGINRSKIHFLPNVVDIEYFKPSKKKNRTFRMLWVGRLEKQKRPHRFVHLFSLIQKEYRLPIEGTMVGEGSLGNELEQLSVDLGLDNRRFKFYGKTDNILQLYQNADCLISTSDYEGTPNVVMEAMACGLPVVASAVGDATELITNNENGMLYDASDDKMLNRQIDWIINHPKQSKDIGLNARDYVVRNYSLNQLPHYLSDLYSAIA